jgi:hypothetical protein
MSYANVVSTYSKTFGFNVSSSTKNLQPPSNFVAVPKQIISFGSNIDFSYRAKTVTFVSVNGNKTLNDAIPGDYTIRYNSYGIESSGKTAETYYPPQPADRVFVLSSTRSSGSNNSIFVDKSTNNRSITVTGDVTTASVSPYEEDLSANLINANSTITVASSVDLALDSNNFTLETWIKPSNNSFYILKGENDYNLSIGYNLDDNDQGIVIGTKDPTSVATVEPEINLIDLDTTTDATVTWGERILFQVNVGSVLGNVDYTITSIESSQLSNVLLSGTMSLSSNLTVASFNILTSLESPRTLEDFVFTATLPDATIKTANIRLVSGVELSAFTTDVYEESTVLLLTTEDNVAQNNTFLDSSTNNFTITRNGNTTQGSFSPYGSNWSNYFDGSSDYLTVPSNSGFSFGTGDFTVEAWVWYPPVSNTNGKMIIDSRPVSTNGGYWIFGVTNSGVCTFTTRTTSGTRVSDTVARPNQWVHYAATRQGTTLRFFANGQLTETKTDSSNISSSSLLIGRNAFSGQAGDTWWLGNISNIRIVKGTALYTSNFTPSTTPLTAISGTSLLTCQSNRFIDNSTNNFTITRFGDTKVVKFSPFKLAEQYSPETYGGSGYFDGTGDYLTISNDSALLFGSGDFTVETWVYKTTASVGWIAGFWSYTNPGNQSWALYDSSGYAFTIQGDQGAEDYTILSAANSSVLNQWTHVAVTRSGSTWKLFVNGVQSATATYSGTLATPGNVLGIGIVENAPNTYSSYLSNLRVVKGTAVYTANFTPPTAPVTAVDNTSLLLNFTNAGIVDNSTSNILESVGNVQSSTQIKKYGESSIYFDGNGDYLFVPGNNIMNFGTGNFTIETWLYLNALPTADSWPTNYSSHMVIITVGSVSTADGIGLLIGSSRLGIQNNDTMYWSNAHGLTINTWYHIAVSRSGNTLYFFLNGVALGTSTFNVTAGTGSDTYIGCETGQGAFLNGYIDELRVTRGIARYTDNFTPPLSITTAVPVGITVDSESIYGENLTFNYVASVGEFSDGTELPYQLTGVEPVSISGNTSGNIKVFDSVSSLILETTETGASCIANLTITLPNTVVSANTFLSSGTSGITGQNGQLVGDDVVLWGDPIICKYYDTNIADYSTISYTINGLTTEHVEEGVLPNQDMIVLNGLATLSIKTKPNLSLIIPITIDFTLPDSNVITYTATIEPKLKIETQANLNLDQWNHLAVSRQNSNINLHLNGQLALTSNIGNYTFGNSAVGLTIGGDADQYLIGKLADLHLVKYENLYTGATYNVPAARLTARANTALLTFGRSIESSNVFVDASTFNHTITSNTAINVYESPTTFGIYTREQNYGSGYFDGTDYLSITSGAAVGTQDFTIESWVYVTAFNTWNHIFSSRPGAVNDSTTWGLLFHSSGYPLVYSDGVQIQGGAGQIPLRTWTHVAASRQGSTMRLFVNGLLVQTSTTSQNYTTDAAAIGANRDGSETMIGFLADVKLTIGAALYTSSFTRPTSPATADANTSILLNFDNPTVYDDVDNMAVGLISGATVDLVNKNNEPFAIDCTGSKYLRILSPRSRVDMTSSNTWSIEFGFKNASITSGTDLASYGNRNGYATWLFYIDGTSLRFYSSSNNSSWNIASNLNILTSMTIDTWYKIRLSRDTVGYKIYVNDSLVQSISYTGAFFQPTSDFIVFGAAANATLQSSIYVEGIKINNTGVDFIAENTIGSRSINTFTHTYGTNYFAENSRDPLVISNAGLTINSSIGPTAQYGIKQQVFPISVKKTHNTLQQVVKDSGSYIEEILENNDPTLERNPRPAGTVSTTTTTTTALQRIWY